MSLQTWREEFYPCSADSEEALSKPVSHSLRKWEGLRKENLDKHDVYYNGGMVNERVERRLKDSMPISGETCSLCASQKKRVIDESIKNGVDCSFANLCIECPIVKTRDRDCMMEFIDFQDNKNPEEMIYLLSLVKEKFPEL